MTRASWQDSGWWRALWYGCLAVLALGGVVFLGYSILAIVYPYPLDYTEGSVLYQVRLLTEGVQTYQPLEKDPQIIIAYPPVWPYLLAALHPLTGLGLWSARLISTLAALAAAGLLGWMVAGETGDREGGVLSGLLFLSIPYVLATSSLNRSDTWALLMSLLGIFVVWKARGRGWWPALSILFFLLAGYSRQSNLLAGPLAAYGWLFLQGERKKAIGLGLGLLAAVLVAFAVLNVWTDGGLYFNAIVAPADPFHPAVALAWVLRVVRGVPVLVGLAAFFFILRLAEKRVGIAWLYLLGAGATLLLTGKIGAHVNYLLEFSAALAWVAGLVWAYLKQEGVGEKITRGLLAALLAVQVISCLSTAQGLLPKLWHYRQMLEEGRTLETWIWEADGPMLADAALGYLVLKGQDPVWQPFEHASLIRLGLWDQTPFVQRIQRGEFALIVIQPDIAPWAWTPEMLETIASRYELVAEAAGQQVYAPRTGP